MEKSSFARKGGQQGKMAEEIRQVPHEADLAFDQTAELAQPAFTTGIAKEPPHAAEGAGDGTILVAGKRGHSEQRQL
jgi:hypothetical protein